MALKKGGCILVDLKNKKIGLVYRKKKDDYSFPKGHIEEGESVIDCAIRETIEETGRNLHLVSDKEIGINKYKNGKGNDVDCYFYLAIDEGPSNKEIDEIDKEELVWVDFDKVGEVVSFRNLNEFWEEIKDKVEEILK